MAPHASLGHSSYLIFAGSVFHYANETVLGSGVFNVDGTQYAYSQQLMHVLTLYTHRRLVEVNTIRPLSKGPTYREPADSIVQCLGPTSAVIALVILRYSTNTQVGPISPCTMADNLTRVPRHGVHQIAVTVQRRIRRRLSGLDRPVHP